MESTEKTDQGLPPANKTKRPALIGLIAVVAVLVIAGIVIALVAHHKHAAPVAAKTSKPKTVTAQVQSKNTSISPAAAAPAATTAPTATPPPAKNIVDIQSGKFNPADLTVKPDTYVTWLNLDTVAQSVVESDGKAGPNSGPILPNHPFGFVYYTTGTYKYASGSQPAMTGTVTVTN